MRKKKFLDSIDIKTQKMKGLKNLFFLFDEINAKKGCIIIPFLRKKIGFLQKQFPFSLKTAHISTQGHKNSFIESCSYITSRNSKSKKSPYQFEHSKLIIIITSLHMNNFAGTEKVLRSVIQYLEKHNYNVIFIYRNGSPDSGKLIETIPLDEKKIFSYKWKPITFGLIRRYLKSFLWTTPSLPTWRNIHKTLERVIKKYGVPHTIISTELLQIFDIKKALEKMEISNTKIIIYPHNSLIKPPLTLKDMIKAILLNRLYKFACKYTDASIAISTGIKKQLLNYGCSKSKTYLVFNPIEHYKGKLIGRPKVKDIPIFIYIGRLHDYQKNLLFLLKGLSLIKNKKWKLIIIGDGPDENKLKEYAHLLGISKKVQWVGFKKYPFEGLDKVSALLLTSRYEGFGLVLAEANQRGIPVISSNCPVGPKDIIANGKNGYLFPEGNIEKFVELLDKIIDGNLKFDSPENIAKMCERFSIEQVGNRILKALQSLEKQIS